MPQTHRQAPELGFAALQYAVNCAAGGARSNHTPGRLPRGCCWRRCRRCCQPPHAPRQSNVAAAPCAFPSRTHPWRPPPPSHAAVPGTRGAACRCCWWQAPARCSSSLWLVRGTTTQGQYLPRFATQPATAAGDAAHAAPCTITTPQLRYIASWQGGPGPVMVHLPSRPRRPATLSTLQARGRPAWRAQPRRGAWRHHRQRGGGSGSRLRLQQSAGRLLRRVPLPRLPGGCVCFCGAFTLEAGPSNPRPRRTLSIFLSFCVGAELGKNRSCLQAMCPSSCNLALAARSCAPIWPASLLLLLLRCLQHMVRDVLAPMFSNGIADLINLR